MTKNITLLTGRHGIPAPDLLATLMAEASYFKLMRFDPEATDGDFAREIAMVMNSNPDVLVLDRAPGELAQGVINTARDAGIEVRIAL